RRWVRRKWPPIPDPPSRRASSISALIAPIGGFVLAALAFGPGATLGAACRGFLDKGVVGERAAIHQRHEAGAEACSGIPIILSRRHRIARDRANDNFGTGDRLQFFRARQWRPQNALREIHHVKLG